MRAWLVLALVVVAAACGHVQPASSEGVPPPWPATDPTAVQKTAAPAPPPEPTGTPVVPPLKRTDKNPP
jgi:hypothetical protein